jgi:hypothetical protein
MERVAQCHCGSLRVIASGEPERVYVCHCNACQRRTGTAFHFGVSYPKDRVRIDGEHKIYQRAADSGSNIRFYFCPTCGSNLYWESDRNPNGCGVAGGAFVDQALPPPTSSIFEDEMFEWLAFPTVAEHFPKGRPPVTG